MIEPRSSDRRRGSGSGRGQWLIRLIGPVLSAVAIILLLGSVDVPATAASLADVRFGPVVPALGLVVVQAVVVTLRWRALLPGGGRMALSGLLRAVFVGYLGNFVLPARMGEIARAIIVARSERMSLGPILGSIVLERVIDISVLAIGVALASLVLGAPAWIVEVSLLAAIAGILAVVLLSTGLIGRLGRLIGRFGRLRMMAFLGRAIGEVAAGATVIGRGGPVMLAIGLTVLSWLLEGTVYWLAAAAVGVQVPPTAALLVAAGTVLATAIPSAPAYVGTFELAATTLAVAFGVPAADALAWAVVAHVVTVVPLAIGGLVALFSLEATLGQLVSEGARRSEIP
jgi:uncharacterized membrane protein YbhN (UPF0104 family)